MNERKRGQMEFCNTILLGIIEQLATIMLEEQATLERMLGKNSMEKADASLKCMDRATDHLQLAVDELQKAMR